MPGELRWEREGFESRADAAADAIEEFVEAVLAGIDVESVRASPEQWQRLCEFFAGCTTAATMQEGCGAPAGERVAAYLNARFPCQSLHTAATSAGLYEFMDWLANPRAFRPSRLREVLKR